MDEIILIVELDVIYYLDSLVNDLYHEEYFSYRENADAYVQKIYEFKQNSIHTFPHKKTPEELSYLGLHYIFYKSNARTTWYIFFEKQNSSYIVTGILNNHCVEAQLI